jgi:hypothetical protein
VLFMIAKRSSSLTDDRTDETSAGDRVLRHGVIDAGSACARSGPLGSKRQVAQIQRYTHSSVSTARHLLCP